MAGQMIAKGEHRWLLRIYKGRNAANNKRIYLARMFSGDEDAAKAELAQMIASPKLEASNQNRNITVDQFFEQWLSTFAENRYQRRTVRNYKELYASNIQPVIGSIRLADVQPSQLQLVLRRMAERGVSSNSLRKYYSLLSVVLDCAVAWGLLKHIPISDIEIPRRILKEMRALTQKEVSSLLAVTDQGPQPEFFRTALITGMRPGELFALRWSDIDFEAQSITVQRSLVWLDGAWELTPPKTERGRRQIAIPESLTRSLRELKPQQHPKHDCHEIEHDFVFITKTGEPWRSGTFSRHVFKPALKRAGLPKSIRLQDLRHTNATLLIKDGENIKVVSERLGHSNINITLEIYVHILPGTQSHAADRIDSILGDPGHTE